jgi:hypothetical protein
MGESCAGKVSLVTGPSPRTVSHPMTSTRDELQRWFGEAFRGVCRIAVVSPFNASEMTIAAAAGDPDAQQAMRQVERALKRLHGFVRSKKAPLCLFCPTALWRRHLPDAVIIISPYWGEGRQMACHFVCHDCCAQLADSEALNDALLQYYRDNGSTGLRLLPPLAHAGRA